MFNICKNTSCFHLLYHGGDCHRKNYGNNGGDQTQATSGVLVLDSKNVLVIMNGSICL